jgi:hypothetical protein
MGYHECSFQHTYDNFRMAASQLGLFPVLKNPCSQGTISSPRAYKKARGAIAMNFITTGKAAAVLAGLAAMILFTGCRVHVDKGANGEDKNVRVDTPFGGVHVNTDQTTAADLGLPVYPGAQITPDSGNDKSADVHVGFGEWELRVKIVNYATPDNQQKVTDFYRKALAGYGDVLSCQDGVAVGTPSRTSQGLGCDDKEQADVHISGNSASYGYNSSHSKGFQLKAGSKRHQHIVAFQSSRPDQTRFTLMALDLPTSASDKSN